MITRIFTLLIIFSFSKLAFAQNNLIDSTRYIEVSGSAEIEITPNKIIIAAYLAERIERKEKIHLSVIESKFNTIVKSLGIDPNKVLLDNASGNYTQIKKRQSDILATKIMFIEFNDIDLANRFLDALKDADIANNIRKKTHTDLPRFRKETKIEAVKAAKEKAAYLIEAAGAKIGKVLRVVEPNENNYGTLLTSQSYNRSNKGSNSFTSDDSIGGAFSPIKMRYEMNVIYEIID